MDTLNRKQAIKILQQARKLVARKAFSYICPATNRVAQYHEYFTAHLIRTWIRKQLCGQSSLEVYQHTFFLKNQSDGRMLTSRLKWIDAMIKALEKDRRAFIPLEDLY